MLRRKKLNQIRRKRDAERKAKTDLEAQNKHDKEMRERQIRLKKYQKEHNQIFWKGYLDSLRRDKRIKQEDKPLKAFPCTKPRTVIDPY